MGIPDGTRRSLFSVVTRGTHLSWFVGTFAVGLALTPRISMCQGLSATPETVWDWSANCRQNKKINIDLLANGRTIHHSSLPICRVNREDLKPEQGQEKIVFFLKGGHTYQNQYRTVPAQRVEVHIWQAGMEADGLSLGVSFSTKHQVLLNSLHFAMPDRPSQTKLDRGLVIKTYPAFDLNPHKGP